MPSRFVSWLRRLLAGFVALLSLKISKRSNRKAKVGSGGDRCRIELDGGGGDGDGEMMFSGRRGSSSDGGGSSDGRVFFLGRWDRPAESAESSLHWRHSSLPAEEASYAAHEKLAISEEKRCPESIPPLLTLKGTSPPHVTRGGGGRANFAPLTNGGQREGEGGSFTTVAPGKQEGDEGFDLDLTKIREALGGKAGSLLLSHQYPVNPMPPLRGKVISEEEEEEEKESASTASLPHQSQHQWRRKPIPKPRKTSLHPLPPLSVPSDSAASSLPPLNYRAAPASSSSSPMPYSPRLFLRHRGGRLSPRTVNAAEAAGGGGGVGGGGGGATSLFNELAQIDEEEVPSAFDPVVSTEKEALLLRRRRHLHENSSMRDRSSSGRYSVCGGSRRASVVSSSGQKKKEEEDDGIETRSLVNFRLDLNGNSGVDECGYFAKGSAVRKSLGAEDGERSLDSGMFTGSDAASSENAESREKGTSSQKLPRKWLEELSKFFSLPLNEAKQGKMKDREKEEGQKCSKSAGAAAAAAGCGENISINRASLPANEGKKLRKENGTTANKEEFGEEEEKKKKLLEEDGHSAKEEEIEEDSSVGGGKVKSPSPPAASLIGAVTPESPNIPSRDPPSPSPAPSSSSTSSISRKQRLIRQQLRRHTFGRVKNFVSNRSCHQDSEQQEGDDNIRQRKTKSHSTPSTPRVGARAGINTANHHASSSTPFSSLATPRLSKRAGTSAAATPRMDLSSSHKKTSLAVPPSPRMRTRTRSRSTTLCPSPILAARRGNRWDEEGGEDDRPACEEDDWRTRVWLELNGVPEEAAHASVEGDKKDEDEVPPPPQPPPAGAVPDSHPITLQLLHECRPTCNYRRDLSRPDLLRAGGGGQELHQVLWYRFLGR